LAGGSVESNVRFLARTRTHTFGQELSSTNVCLKVCINHRPTASHSMPCIRLGEFHHARLHCETIGTATKRLQPGESSSATDADID